MAKPIFNPLAKNGLQLFFEPEKDIKKAVATDAIILKDTSGNKKWSIQHNTNTVKQDFYSPEPDNKILNSGFETDLSSWTSVLSYILNDQFTTARLAGTLNATQAEPTGGTRTVTDTGNKISIASSILNYATGETINDGLWYSSLARVAGKTLIQTVIPSDTNGIINVGWDTNTSGVINDQLVFAAAGVLQIVPNGGTAISVGVYTATTYYVAGVMRGTGFYWYIKGGAFTNWTLLWITAAGTAAGVPATNVGSTTSIFTTDDIKVPTNLWLPTPLAYDSFTTDTGFTATETTGPDGVTGPVVPSLAWTQGTGSTWAVSSGTAHDTPALGGEALTDGGLENWNSATDLTSWTEEIAGTSTVNRDTDKNGGTYDYRADVDAGTDQSRISQFVTSAVGNWLSISFYSKSNPTGQAARVGTTNMSLATEDYSLTTSYAQKFFTGRVTTANPDIFIGRGIPSASSSVYIDDVSVKPLTLSSLFSTVPSGKADVIASTNITLTAGTQAGLVLNLDSTSNPQNFVLVYHDGINVKVDKSVNGTYTTVASTLSSYDGGGELRVIKYGNLYRIYYKNNYIGAAERTISDASIVSNTIHGLFSTYSGNTFDNFTLFARGTGNEYSSAPFEELTVSRDTSVKYAGTASAKLIAGGTDANFLQSLNVGDTNTYVFIAYAYKGSGQTVTTDDINLYYDTGVISTSFSSMGGDWYKLTGTITGANAAKDFGVRVKAGKTVYVDTVSLQAGVGPTIEVTFENSSSGVANATFENNVDVKSVSIDGVAGVDGSYTTADSKTVTVSKGVITDIT